MIMMSLHEVKSSCKCTCDDTSWLSNSNNRINRQRIIFLAHLQADIDKVSFVTSYNVSDVMASRNDITTYANIKSMIFLNSATKNTIETNKNHISSTAASWDRYSLFNDVMTSFCDVIPSCKYDNNNKVAFSNQRNYINENGISSRIHLQAKMKKVSFLT